MADTERVFSYRLLRIARADQTPLAGFDENAWAASAPHGAPSRCRTSPTRLIAVRRATLSLVRSLDEAAVSRTRRRQQQARQRARHLLDHRRATRSIISTFCRNATRVKL